MVQRKLFFQFNFYKTISRYKLKELKKINYFHNEIISLRLPKVLNNIEFQMNQFI